MKRGAGLARQPAKQAALEHLQRVDRHLGEVIQRVGGCALRPADYATTFEALARSIVYQQLSGKAADTIYGRFVTAFGDGRRPDPGRIGSASLQALRDVGLSRAKAGYIQGLAFAERDGSLPDAETLRSLSDVDVAALLTGFRGVGLWTAQMLMIFWLGRPDVLPADDLGVRKGMKAAHGLKDLPTPAAVLEIGQRWAPYRSFASWYLWRAAEL